jgi:histidine ammonia-lyase
VRIGEALTHIREVVRPVAEDRVLSGDIEALAATVRTGTFDPWR